MTTIRVLHNFTFSNTIFVRAAEKVWNFRKMVTAFACYLLPCIVFFALLRAGVPPVTLPTAQKNTIQASRIFGAGGLQK